MLYTQQTTKQTQEMADSMILGDRIYSSQARGTTTYNVDTNDTVILLVGSFVPGYVEAKGPQKAPKGRASASVRTSFQTHTNPILTACGRTLADAVAAVAAQTPEGKANSTALTVPNIFEPKSEEYTTLYLKPTLLPTTTWVNSRGVEVPAVDLEKALAAKDSPPIRVEVYVKVASITVSATSPDVTFQLALTDIKVLSSPVSRFASSASSAAMSSPQAGPALKRQRSD
jgi:hypothetical protein